MSSHWHEIGYPFLSDAVHHREKLRGRSQVAREESAEIGIKKKNYPVLVCDGPSARFMPRRWTQPWVFQRSKAENSEEVSYG